MARLSRSARFWIILSAVNLTIPAVLIWKVHATDLTRSAAFSSCWISFVSLNALFLVALRNRASNEFLPPNRDRVVFTLLFAIPAALATSAYLWHYFETNTYYDLAMSDQPLYSIHPERRRLVVELMRQRIASSKAYQTAASHFHPISPPLYSPESFATVDVMNDTVQQLLAAFGIDTAYSRGLANSMNGFEQQMRQVDPAYLQSWIASDESHERQQSETSAAEDQWVKSVQTLYQYAAGHHQDIHVRKGKLVVSSDEVRTKFDDLENSSKTLQQSLQKARSNLLKDQQKAARDSRN